MQVVCDGDLLITDVDCRWPGSSHDGFVLANSTIRQRMEDREFTPYWLLGDSGYGCRSWLLTPLLEANTAKERRFNVAQKRARCVVERCIGVLKSRFRWVCLTYLFMFGHRGQNAESDILREKLHRGHMQQTHCGYKCLHVGWVSVANGIFSADCGHFGLTGHKKPKNKNIAKFDLFGANLPRK